MAIALSSVSRPAYGTLLWVPAPVHVLACDDNGFAAIHRLRQIDPPGPPSRLMLLMLAPADSGKAADFASPSPTAFGKRLGEALAEAGMGARLYAAGSEDFLALATRIAVTAGLTPDAMLAERSNAPDVSVQCAHCKTIQHGIRTRILRCAGCDSWLVVRDHYSRRLGAYQGVAIDAADPDFARLSGESLR